MKNVLDQALQLECDITMGELVYNPSTRVLKNSTDKVIAIDQRSLEVLEILLSNVGTPVDSETMLCRVWKNKFISKNVVTNRVCFLRGIVRDNVASIEPRELLKTYPKKGYYLSPNYVELRVEDNVNGVPLGCTNTKKLWISNIRHIYYLALFLFMLCSYLVYRNI